MWELGCCHYWSFRCRCLWWWSYIVQAATSAQNLISVVVGSVGFNSRSVRFVVAPGSFVVPYVARVVREVLATAQPLALARLVETLLVAASVLRCVCQPVNATHLHRFLKEKTLSGCSVTPQSVLYNVKLEFVTNCNYKMFSACSRAIAERWPWSE